MTDKKKFIFILSLVFNAIVILVLLIRLFLTLIVPFFDKSTGWDYVWDYHQQYKFRPHNVNLGGGTQYNSRGRQFFTFDKSVSLQNLSDAYKDQGIYEVEFIEFFRYQDDQKATPAILLSKELKDSFAFFLIVDAESEVNRESAFEVLLPVFYFGMPYQLLFPAVHTVLSSEKVDRRTAKFKVNATFDYIASYYQKDNIIGSVDSKNLTITVWGRTRISGGKEGWEWDDIKIILQYYQTDDNAFWMDMVSTTNGGW
ncbi:MAG: hypothetical protein LBU60_06345 [Clostridiales bacterium]|jgi:hypothetical protein|nr:hypothetical protein [Clostridiales bacterium]